MKPAYFHGHPGAPDEVQLAGLTPSDFAPATADTTHVIGFSLGGVEALAFTAMHPDVTRLDLIACPAPLGDVIPDMAGKPVFKAARSGRLPALTALQATLLRLAPNLFLKALFASAPASEKRLLTKKPKAILQQSYKVALFDKRPSYLSSVTAFVDQNNGWPCDKITCTVNIWQGQSDTWVPPDMAQNLAQMMPQATLHSLPELGHYGTLVHALRMLMQP